MKGILYFFAGCIVVGMTLTLIMSQFASLSAIGNSMLFSFSNGQYEQAYEFFSDDFKQKYPLPAFVTLIQQSGLEEYKAAEWKQDVMDKNTKRGLLSGVVITKQNKQIFVEMDFALNQGSSFMQSGWEINDIRIESLTQPRLAPTVTPEPPVETTQPLPGQ